MRLKFNILAANIAAAERDKPGTRAQAWKSPIRKAGFFHLISRTIFFTMFISIPKNKTKDRKWKNCWSGCENSFQFHFLKVDLQKLQVLIL